MKLTVNAQERDFPELNPGAALSSLIEAMSLKGDRVAVEHNGAIVARAEWPQAQLQPGDRLEIVHFVGGGASF